MTVELGHQRCNGTTRTVEDDTPQRRNLRHHPPRKFQGVAGMGETIRKLRVGRLHDPARNLQVWSDLGGVLTHIMKATGKNQPDVLTLRKPSELLERVHRPARPCRRTSDRVGIVPIRLTGTTDER